MASHNRTHLLVNHYSSTPSIPWGFPDLASNSSWFDDASAEWQAYTTTVSSLDEVNSTVNATDDPGGAGHDDIITNKGVQAVFCILYTLIFILGMFGNALVCYVVGRNRSMQTVTNLFITNLALSDVLLCMLAVPFTPLYSFLRRWIFGKALCHLMPYAQGTSVYVSTLTLTSIAVDRFFVIIHPFRPRMRMGTCIAVIIGIWAFSLLVTFPYGLYMTQYFIIDRFYCEEDWPSERLRQIYGGLTATMQFIIPLIVIAYCYIRVSLRLNDRARCKPGSNACSLAKKSSRREEMDRERKRRTNRMLIAMVLIFGVSWLPINVLNVMNDFYIFVSHWKYYSICFFTVHAVAMSSTCYNPFLYAWLNENFRKEFKQVLPCFGPTAGTVCNTEMTGCGAMVRTGRSTAGGGQGTGGGTGDGVGSLRRGSSGGWRRRSDRACNGNEVSTVQETLLPPSQTSSVSQPGSRRCSMGTGSRGMQSVVTTATQVDESPEEEVDGPLVQYSVEKDAVELRIKEIGGRTEDDDSEEESKNGVILGPSVGDSSIGELV